MEPRQPNKRMGIDDTLLYYDRRESRRRTCLQICCIICCVTIVILVLLAFLLTFVGVPMIFKNSPDWQRKLVFPTKNLLPLDPEFSNFKKYNIQGARNIYVTVNHDEGISLGVWHLLPHALVNESLESENYDYEAALEKADFPVVIHFHANGGNRIQFSKMYDVLREFFHVIAFDYRGFGDSSPLPPSEEVIVQDSLELFKWVREQTNADIYFWGHAVGAALATHAVVELDEGGFTPTTGVFLEAPFTNMRDQVNEISVIRKLFSWMPWYESTILKPLEKNGFSLDTASYIRQVDCPVMIIHAKDDLVTSYTLSEKLFKIAQDYRDPATQGNVSLHLLPESSGYGHSGIRKEPHLPDYIRAHIEVCEAFAINKSSAPNMVLT